MMRDEMLKFFSMRIYHLAKVSSLPLINIHATNSEQSLDNITPYRQLVWSFLYLAATTRLDISYAAAYLSRFKHNLR